MSDAEKWRRYEEAKKRLRYECATAADYEKRLREIAGKLGI